MAAFGYTFGGNDNAGSVGGQLSDVFGDLIAKVKTGAEEIIGSGTEAVKTALPVWVDQLFELQEQDGLANPTRGPGSFDGNINQNPELGPVSPAGTIQGPGVGPFSLGSVNLSTTETVILGGIAALTVVLILRLARVI